MFGKLFNTKAASKDKNHQYIVDKISNMNLSKMRSYVRNSIKDFEISEDGLQELMKKLITKDEKTKKYYINSDDMDTKKKKAFELIMLIANSKKLNIVIVEDIQKFVEIYKDIILAYDKELKEIYFSRLEDAIALAISNLDKINTLQKKMKVLGE